MTTLDRAQLIVVKVVATVGLIVSLYNGQWAIAVCCGIVSAAVTLTVVFAGRHS